MYKDIIIIGAGVVGSALARELSKYELNIAVLEARYDICEGASKANSGIVHAGYDAKPGTLKAKLNVEGAKMFPALCQELSAPYKQTGALVIGFDEADKKQLECLYSQGLENGIEGLEIIDGDKARKMEPQLSREVTWALNIPSSGICSPYELTYNLADHASINGVEFLTSTEVEKISFGDDGLWHISTNQGEFIAKAIVNCAGVFSAELHNQISDTKLKIIPRKGEYYLLDRKEPLLFNRTIFQTPTNMGKGVLVSPTCHGNILLGPSSTDISDPLDVSTTSDMLSYVFEKSRLTWSESNKKNVITTFAGIRAHEENGDFVIGRVSGTKNAYEALGIESPGLSASPAIAIMLRDIIVEDLKAGKKNNWKPALLRHKSFHNMNMEERQKAAQEDSNFGKIVCRCEQVTEAEIREAIRRPVGAKTVDGVKRRTRAGMGRCQGGFCSSRVIEILAEELGVDKTEIKKSSKKSNIFFGKIEDFSLKGEK